MRATEAGYSLIELLVVIGILVLVAGVAVPVADRVIATSSRRSDAHAIMTTLRHCQDTAISQQRTVAIDHGDHPFEACKAPDFHLADGAQIDVPEPLRFFADGTSTGGSVVLSEAGKSTRITVEWMTGIPKLEPFDAR